MINIRPLTLQDILSHKSKILNLLKQNLEINLPELNNLDDDVNTLWENMKIFIEDGSAVIIGAMDENEILLGFLWAYERNNLRRELFITELIVDKNQRSNGIGRFLLNELYKIAKNKNISKLGLTTTFNNSGALKFYSNNGFIIERVFLRKDIL